jgi:hypothetical protein
MKRRIAGFLMCIPAPIVLLIAAPTCQKGTVTGGPGYGPVLDNVLTGLFILGLMSACLGGPMVFGKQMIFLDNKKKK